MTSAQERDGRPGWLGPPLSRTEMAAVLFAGIAGIMFAGVGPLLLGALERTGRLTASQIGQAGMIELLTMGLAAGLTGTVAGIRHLRLLTLTSGLAIALLDAATLLSNGWVLVALRGLAGIPSGALIWLMTAMIVRVPHPERWSAIYLTTQALAQFLVVTALGAWIMLPFGPNGGFLVLAAIGLAAALAALAVPRAFAPLPVSDEGDSGLLSLRGLVALCAAFCFNAGILSVWIYIEPLSRQAGHPPETAALAMSLSLAAQLAGGGLATLLAGRVRWLAALVLSQLAMMMLMFLFARLPGAGMFLVASVLFGGLWMFSAPMLTPLAIEADPTRRAAVLGSGAALLGCSTGPLVASFVVTDGDVRGSALLGCGMMALAIATVVSLHLTRRQPTRTHVR